MGKREIRDFLSLYTSPYKKHQWLVVLTAFLQIFTNIGIAISLKVIIDNALRQKTLVFLVAGCLSYLLCSVCNVCFTVLKQRYASLIGEGAIGQLRNDLIAHYLQLPVLTQLKIKSGDLLTLCMQDTSALKEIISSQYARRITNTATAAVLITSMLFLDWRFTMLVLAGIPFFLLTIFFFGDRLKTAEKNYLNKNESLSQFIIQTASGAEVIKHLDAPDTMLRHFTEKVRNFRKAMQSKRMLGSLKDVSENFLSVAFTGVFMVFGGYLLLDYKTGTLGVFLSFMTLIPVLFNALADSISLFLEERRSRVNLERIHEIFSTPAEKSGKLDALKDGFEIRVEHVSFRYDDQEVLHDINLQIMPGEKIAIVGQSGSGKSTLAYLLAGLFQPQTGKVLFGGHPLADYTEEARGNMVTMMEQVPFFFESSIRDIICGNEDCEVERMCRIAEETGLNEDISNLPEGYSSMLSEKTELSGGQKQRLALARSLYRQTRVLILDEPTSALDQISQDRLFRLLQGALADKTVIMVTHDRNLAAKADRVVQIENGKCVFDGSAELFSADNQ